MAATIGEVLLLGSLVALALTLARPRLAAPLPMATAAVVAATCLLGWALVTDDYSLRYVAESARRGVPGPMRLAGLWGGMAGSLLFFTALLLAWLSVVTLVLSSRHAELAATGRRLAAATGAVFLTPLLVVTRPFETLALPPLDGAGLVPVLEHPAMLYHPPLLYLGLTAFAGPALVAAASSWTGTRPAGVGTLIHRLMVLAVALLGAGMLTGARWAYVEAGWGGLWAWDPIENAALIPWLVGVAALHERGRRRDGLVVAAFLCAVAGTVLTRSGATVSVHAFGEAGAVGWILFAGLIAGTAAWVATLLRRRGIWQQDPASWRRIQLAKQESAHPPAAAARWPRLVVAVLGAAATVVAIGTFGPAIAGVVRGRPGVAGPEFFSRFAVPLLMVAAALALLAAVRNPRPAAVAAAHAGAVLLAAGAVGSTFGSSATVALAPGPPLAAAGREASITGVSGRIVDGRRELVADVLVDGQRLRPAIREGRAGGATTAEAALRSSWAADVMVVPRRISARGTAVVDIHIRPLVALVWTGGLLFVAGAALSLAGRPRDRHGSDRAGDRASAAGGQEEAPLDRASAPADGRATGALHPEISSASEVAPVAPAAAPPPSTPSPL